MDDSSDVSIKRLRDVPLALNRLTKLLHADRELLKDIQILITESKEVINAYASAMETEGNDVLSKREVLIKVKKPSKVEVDSLQKSLSKYEFALSNATTTLKAFERKVHCKFERLRDLKKQNDGKVERLNCQNRRLKQDIEELERKIEAYSTEVNNKVSRGRKCNNQAMSAIERCRDTVSAGIVWSAVGAFASFALTPFSGRLGLLVGAAAVGFSVDSTITAVSISKGAKNMQKQANQEFSDAESVRSKIESLHEEMFIVTNKIREIKWKIWELETTTFALEKIKDFLLLAIGEMNTTERQVQDLEAAILGASQHGECFHELQLALAEYPEPLEEFAIDCMKELKEKWNIVRTHIWNTCR